MIKYLIKARGFTLPVGEKTLLMGVMNLTPDSFSHDGLLTAKNDPKANCRFALRLIKEGADILDIGGESTRPGSRRISTVQELQRILPTLRLLSAQVKVPISIDTYKPQVAHACLDAGASIINNIMGTKVNRPLLKLVRDYGAAIVLMHMRATPRTMQRHAKYKNLMAEIIRELRVCIENCLEIGIKKDRIIIDPGIGFAKTAEQNLEIINHLNKLQSLKLPILIGTSRKSFIGRTLGKDADDRLWGTSATVTAAIMRGAHIVRVHDVKAMNDVAAMADAIIKI